MKPQYREKRPRTIVEAAVADTITIDERGMVESVNAAVERIFGHATGEMIGKNISRLASSSHREPRYRRPGNFSSNRASVICAAPFSNVSRRSRKSHVRKS